MRKPLGIAVAVASLIMLAGCTTSSEAAPQAPSVEPAGPTASPSTSPTPTPSTSTSARGNLTKNVGDTFGLSTSSGESAADFKVTAITLDPSCTSPYASAPQYGHFVRLDVEGETTAALPQDLFFASGAWTVVAENGTTFNGDPWSGAAVGCLDSTERLPNIIGPGERVAGAVILDVPSPTGVIILDPDGQGGWEWNY